jgi:hypothetical protein
MDVLAVREGVKEGLRIAREERKPTLIEAITYRFRGHSAADPEVYREKEEVEEWRAKDPIETFAKRCADEGMVSEDELTEIREAAEKTVLEAVEFADNSPEPPLDSLYENLYVVSDTMGWYAVDERSPAPHRGEREAEAPAAAKELAEAGAAYAGRPAGPRPNPAESGDAQEGEAREDEGAREDMEADSEPDVAEK